MASAEVHAIQRLADFQAALTTFRDKAKAAADSNLMEIRRCLDWLESQLQFWKGEIRRAEEAVFVAKQELTRRKMMRISDRPPDTTEQEKALRRAQARLAHAEEKRDNTKAWLIKFPDAVEEYEGQAKPFQDMLEFEMSRMIHFLGEKVAALEAYQQINPSPGGAP
jgi:chromosome segregation ATPase